MLDVIGEAVPVVISRPICDQARGETAPASAAGSAGASPSAAHSHAHAMRHGWRIAAAPPGSGTRTSVPTRAKVRASPNRNSPPHTVWSVP